METRELPARKERLQRDLAKSLQNHLNEFTEDTGLLVDDVKFSMAIHYENLTKRIIVTAVDIRVKL